VLTKRYDLDKERVADFFKVILWLAGRNPPAEPGSADAEIPFFLIQRQLRSFKSDFLAAEDIRWRTGHLFPLNVNHFHFWSAFFRLNEIACFKHTLPLYLGEGTLL
jgi:hypothetical protein